MINTEAPTACTKKYFITPSPSKTDLPSIIGTTPKKFNSKPNHTPTTLELINTTTVPEINIKKNKINDGLKTTNHTTGEQTDSNCLLLRLEAIKQPIFPTQ
jgi:hypothetical protein